MWNDYKCIVWIWNLVQNIIIYEHVKNNSTWYSRTKCFFFAKYCGFFVYVIGTTEHSFVQLFDCKCWTNLPNLCLQFFLRILTYLLNDCFYIFSACTVLPLFNFWKLLVLISLCFIKCFIISTFTSANSYL